MLNKGKKSADLRGVVDLVERLGHSCVETSLLSRRELPVLGVLRDFMGTQHAHLVFVGAELHKRLVREELQVVAETRVVVSLKKPKMVRCIAHLRVVLAAESELAVDKKIKERFCMGLSGTLVELEEQTEQREDEQVEALNGEV